MASVLKQQQVGQDSQVPRPVSFNIEDVQTRAKQYLDEVRQEADQLLQHAKKQAEQIKHQAHQEGLAAADAEFQASVQQAAQKLSDQRCRTAVTSCESAVRELTATTHQWLAQWRNQTVELAARIAEKIVRQKLEVNEELLQAWLEEALVAFRDERELRVLVHPDDFAVAGRFLQSLSKSVPHAADAEVIPDPEVKPGGCIVRSQLGQVDLQLETQLARLVEQLAQN